MVSAIAVEPATSQNKAVTVFRDSRSRLLVGVSGAAQPEQNAAS
jgi:hypothetical protein